METRCYTFGVFYLSSIQQGIQAAHAVADMLVKYADKNSPQKDLAFKWAREDKTMICLNAGNHKSLLELTEVFEESKYPWALFQESYDDLGSIYTCLAVVLPESVYEMANFIRNERNPRSEYRIEYNYGREEHILMVKEKMFILDNKDLILAAELSKKGLAR